MKIAVCVPGHDLVSFFWAYDFARMMAWSAANIPEVQLLQFGTVGTLLQASREKLAEAALKSGADYVLFVDADMRFPKDALKRLLDADKDVVAINYCSRSDPFFPVARLKLTDDVQDRVFQGEGLQEVAATGFGLMLIKAAHLARLPKPRFAVGWSKASESYVTEDMYFAMLLHETGAHIYIDHDLSRECAHTGSFEFTLEHAAQYVYNEVEKAKAEEK